MEVSGQRSGVSWQLAVGRGRMSEVGGRISDVGDRRERSEEGRMSDAAEDRRYLPCDGPKAVAFRA